MMCNLLIRSQNVKELYNDKIIFMIFLNSLLSLLLGSLLAHSVAEVEEL